MQPAETLPSPESPSKRLSFNLKVELDDNRPIYLSGNFNDWQLRDKRFKLNKVGDKEYELKWPEEVTVPEHLEYKYLKGGWDSGEIDRYGNRIENGSMRIHQEDYRRAKQAEFSVLWGKNLKGGRIYAPFAQPSDAGKKKYDLRGSDIQIIE